MIRGYDMKIVITDHHCAAERGDSAILEGAIWCLKKFFPNADFVVMTEYPEAAEIINGVKANRQPMTNFKWNKWKMGLAMVYLLIGARLQKHKITVPKFKHPRIQPYLDADIVISKGGSFLSDYYAPDVLGRFWGLYFAEVLGKPVIIYAQSIGPFEKPFYRWIARYVLNKADLITLRDKESKGILDSIGVTRPPIYVTSDSAFAMPLTECKPMQMMRYEKIELNNKDQLKVSISVRQWGHYKTADGHKKYIKIIAALADWLIIEKNAKVIFASTCTGFAGYHNDDRVIAHEVINHMKHYEEKNPVILYGEYTPQELLAFYRTMDLHVGTRMHSNILAMLAKTPVVAIQYEFKTLGLLNFFDLENYLIDINQINLEILIKKVSEALTHNEQIKAKINEKLPHIKEKSEQNAELVFNLIKTKLGT